MEQAGSTALFPSATNDARLGITNKNFLVGAGTARYVVIGGESPRVTNVVLVLHAPFIGAFAVLIGVTWYQLESLHRCSLSARLLIALWLVLCVADWGRTGSLANLDTPECDFKTYGGNNDIQGKRNSSAPHINSSVEKVK